MKFALKFGFWRSLGAGILLVFGVLEFTSPFLGGFPKNKAKSP
jgi:hypothetical protein